MESPTPARPQPATTGAFAPEETAGAPGPAAVRRDDPRVRVLGRQLAVDGEPFRFAGVCYGTFAPRVGDGALYPPTAQVRADFAQMAAAGIRVVRTYTVPPTDVLDAAGESGLRVIAGLHHLDWRDVLDQGWAAQRRLERDAVRSVAEQAATLKGDARVLAVCIGNETPADVVRWLGTRTVRRHLERLAAAVRRADPQMLVTYANYPSTEHLRVDGLDFDLVNVFLDDPADLRRYLARLLNQAGDRPVVLGEIGRHTNGSDEDETDQAAWLDASLRSAVSAGAAGTVVFTWTDEWNVAGTPIEGWKFGLTRADRSPRPALAALTRWAGHDIRDVKTRWPSISVVVCAYNEERTIGECLEHTCRLDYPDLEILLVDDGSTDRTRAIAETHPGVTVISGGHAGLSAARNTGWAAARGEIIAYLDADAYPSPDWPYHLALAFSGGVGAAGGPNIGPYDDPDTARCVAAAPGGPNHVLFDDRRAEHLPGCNLAIKRDVLAEVGGFDPVYRTAGDDVDICWRILDAGYEIRFAPAALVWHHRRASLRGYLRQQRGYGRAETLVAAHHPQRATPAGSLRWQGRIYAPVPAIFNRGRVYRGPFGTAPFQPAYSNDSGWYDLAHQLAIPAAWAAGIVIAALGLLWRPGALIPAAALIAVPLAMAFVDVRHAGRDPHLPRGPKARLTVAALAQLQPLARLWGRWNADTPPAAGLRRAALTVHRTGRRSVTYAADRPRAEMTETLIAALRGHGLPVSSVDGWEDHDGRIRLSVTATAHLVTSEHPPGVVHARIAVRPRPVRLTLAAAAVAAAIGLGHPAGIAIVAASVALDIASGLRRARTGMRCLTRGGC